MSRRASYSRVLQGIYLRHVQGRSVIAKAATTPSEENYVECLYRRLPGGPVRPSDVADALGVKRPSVTRAMTVLAERGLVHRGRAGVLELTEAGKLLGEQITRRDACLTALLVEVLGMSSEEADPQVHQLEHLLSDDVLARLEVLVQQARGSKAWLAKLQARLTEVQGTAGADIPFALGRAVVHAGAPREKSAPPGHGR